MDLYLRLCKPILYFSIMFTVPRWCVQPFLYELLNIRLLSLLQSQVKGVSILGGMPTTNCSDPALLWKHESKARPLAETAIISTLLCSWDGNMGNMGDTGLEGKLRVKSSWDVAWRILLCGMSSCRTVTAYQILREVKKIMWPTACRIRDEDSGGIKSEIKQVTWDESLKS